MVGFWFLFSAAFALQAFAPGFAQSVHGSQPSHQSTEPQQIQNDTQLSALAREEQWQKVLFYAPTWILGQRSLVDDPRFFLAPQGKSNAEEELKATMRAFEEGSPSVRQEALCKYPARRAWLERKLNRTFADPEPNNSSDICSRHAVFRRSVSANRISLIFSSYFPGNPGSLFGHTLLKFAKVVGTGERGNELLDFGLNHAAHPTTLNPLLYAPMGLAGAFPGYISLMPYYVKVQEYNNAESRDLWEYELSLSADEVQLALLSIFELSNHRIDYYYFDDNCSLLMLAFLDIARPSLKLVEKFNSWVIPGDTVRVVYNQPGLVSKVKFRASNVRRFLSLEAKLSETERNLFNSIVRSKKESRFSLAILEGQSAETKMHVIDTLLEYIDADEQLVGLKEAEKWKLERPELLKQRAQLGLASKPIEVAKPTLEAPHEAYPPTRLSLGAISAVQPSKTRKQGVLLGWRPALHTLDNPIAGMGADLGIAFFNLEYLLHDRKIWLREFTPLGIETMPVEQPQFTAVSWSFAATYKQQCFAACGETSIGGEIGRAWKVFHDNGRFVLRGGLKLGDHQVDGGFVEPSIVSSLNLPFSDHSRWISRVSLGRRQSTDMRPQWNRDIRTSLVLRPANPLEIDFSGLLSNSELVFSTRASWYF